MTPLSHPKLGKIQGLVRDKVVSYLGLKYASLEHRFAEPSIVGAYSEGTYDATKHGPLAVSPPMGCDMEQGLIQKALPHDVFAASETECLHLTINVPEDPVQDLPVFAFLHGGGFMIGANSWPQYDLASIVRESARRGTPIIGIGINYRLGTFGFLHSEELVKNGIKPNRGLRDQRNALLWIKENIAGFGGDPSRVTVIGESAGAVSCTLHLHSEEPLFNQMVAMSGSSLLMKPLPPSVAEFAYKNVLEALGLAGESSEVQREKLMTIQADEILAKVGPTIPLIPVVDNDIVKGEDTYAQWGQPGIRSQLPGASWCKKVLVGDCQFDGSIFTFQLLGRKSGIAKTFQQSATKSLGNHQPTAKALFDAYDIKSDTPDDEALVKILKFGTDIGFFAPALCMAQAWPGAAYVYHFNEPNPWEGPYKGESTHILDIAFLLQNYNDYLSDEQRNTAERFAADFISFVNGDASFPVHEAGKGGARVYGPPASEGNLFVSGNQWQEYGRKRTIWDLAEDASLDQLSLVWSSFIRGE